MIRINDIVDQVVEYNAAADVDLLQRAFVFSAMVHEGQKRLDGEPYLSHPLEVAHLLATMKLDLHSVVTGLLHDTVEDTWATIGQIEEMFGEDVAHLVDGVTKISKLQFNSDSDRQAGNYKKMILAMSKDIRVLLIKLADRLHNMRTLQYLKPEKQKRIAQETLDIYTPLAHRLGISWIKHEMEDMCFRILEPEQYREIEEYIASDRIDRERFTAEVIEEIRRELNQHGIPAEIHGRVKQPYSIYQKLQRRGITIDQVYDLLAFRILVDDVETCYRVLGLIHAMWRPVPGRFKDYIAIPKTNRYQSLHTTVTGPRGERLEIQVRSHQMHHVAEEGIAAHWHYKEADVQAKVIDAGEAQEAETYSWLRSLVDLEQEASNSEEFLESMKVDLFPDQIYVFTPRGDVKTFPLGATPLDFAYAIHSDIGDTCTGAIVNGRMVPLRYRLKTGDRVEIKTSPNQRPSKDWLSIVATAKAKTKIRNYLKVRERDEGVAIGKELLNREFAKRKIRLADEVKSGRFKRMLKELQLDYEDDLFVGLGYGKITIKQVIEALLDEREQENLPQETLIERLMPQRRRRKESGSSILVSGQKDILIHFANCCSPIPGEDIVGFISRGKGVTVHAANCANALSLDPDRRVNVEWDRTTDFKVPARLRILCRNKPGLLAKFGNLFARRKLNVEKANITPTLDEKTVAVFEFLVSNIEELSQIQKDLMRVGGVVSVDRLQGNP